MEMQAFFKPQTANDSLRTVELCFSTGARVLRSREDGSKFFEELMVTPEAVDLSRLNVGAPLLASHRSQNLSDQIGVVEKAWIQGKEARALVRFSQRDEALGLFRDVSSGILRGVSVGYQIVESRTEERPGDPFPTLVASRWVPFEVSLVALPADYLASTRSAEVAPSKNTGEPHPPAPQVPISPGEALRVLARHGISLEEGASFLEQSPSRETFHCRVLDHLAARAFTPRVTSLRDEKENRRDGLEKALLGRVTRDQALIQEASRYATLSLLDMARECAGEGARSLGRDQVVSRAFQMTSDFPEILGNVAKKTLLQSFDRLSARQTFWPLVRVGSVPDFRPFKRVRLAEMPELRELPEGKEYETATLGEDGEESKIATYGRVMGITRQALINDDLGAFQALGNWGAAAARVESQLVWGVFNDNPKISKGIPLFHEKHANCAKKPLPLTPESLSEVRLGMLRQKGLTSEESLGLTPEFLIVPPELQTTAEKLLSRDFTPGTQEEVNPFKGAFQLIVSSNLKDPTSWYMASSPDQGVDLLELSYLDGVRAPYVEWYPCFDNDVLKVKARLDVGVKALDYRGLFKANCGNAAA